MKLSTRRLLWLTLFLSAGFLCFLIMSGHRVSKNFDSVPMAWSKVVRSEAISIQFSPDSKFLMVAGATGTGTWGLSQNGLNYLDFQPRDKRLQLWNVVHQRLVEHLPAKPIFGSWNGDHMLLMPDFKTLVTSWGANDIKVIDVRKRRPDKTVDISNGYLGSMVVSPDGKILVLGMTGEVQFWDAHTFQLLRTYTHGGQGTQVNFNADPYIVECSWGGMKSHFVDIRTAKRVLAPRPAQIAGPQVPNGGFFVRELGPNSIELWKREAGKNHKVRSLKTSLLQIQVIQVSPDNKTVVIGGLSSTEAPIQFFRTDSTQ